MRQFIPFEDDWDVLENLRPEDLIPYRVELLPQPVTAPGVRSPSVVPDAGIFSTSSPMQRRRLCEER